MSTNRFAYQQAAVRDALASETSGCHGKIPGLAHNLSRRGSHRPGRGRNLTGGSNMAQTTFAIDDEAPLIREEWVLLVKMRADWKCTRCGVRPTITRNGRNRRLHAHHINHDPSDHRLANGECLCSGCHSSHHRSTRCAFRNSELQRELGLRVTPEAKKAAGQKASATRRKSPEREAARIASLISKAAAQPPEALSARAVKGWDTRWKTTDAKTHCRNGHLRTPENTGVQSGRWRLCLDCKRDVHIRRREAGK